MLGQAAVRALPPSPAQTEARPQDLLEFFKSIFKQTKPREKQTPQHKPHQNRLCIDALSPTGAGRGQGGRLPR